MDAQDADRALDAALVDLEANTATNPIPAMIAALVLIGRRIVPARSSATDETVPGRRKPEQAPSLASIDPLWNYATGYRLTPPLGGLYALRQDPPRPVVRDRIEGRDADLGAKDRAELAAALTKLETAERTVATLQNTLAERDLKIDRLSFDLARAECERDKAAATAAASVDAISDARRELAAWLGVTGDVPALPDVVERACRRIAVLLEEHQRERTEVDKLRAQVAQADAEADRLAQDRDAPRQSLEQAISDGTALASEARAANATTAKLHADENAALRVLACEAQAERDMAVNEMCEWRNAHARARLAAWEILNPGVPLKGDQTLAQLLDDVREAEAAARRENERCDDLIEYVLAWHQHHAAQDEHDARLRAAIDEWLKEPAEAGPLLAERIAMADARWERIQPLIRALHEWEARPMSEAVQLSQRLAVAFEAWQKAEADALDAEEAKPTPALTARCGLGPGLARLTEDRVVLEGMAFTPDDVPVDLPRQPDDPGVEP